MRGLLVKALKDTVAQIKKDTALMPLAHWNEAVFGFAYSRAVTKLARDVRQFCQCNRIDLVVHHKSERAFVEFKFYMRSPACDPLRGTKMGWKGGPGRKNFREFRESVGKLRRRSASRKVLKLVVLFYCDPISTMDGKHKTFHADYGDNSHLQRELKIRLLHSIRPFSPKGCESICNARLYEVRARRRPVRARRGRRDPSV